MAVDLAYPPRTQSASLMGFKPSRALKGNLSCKAEPVGYRLRT